MSRHMAKVYKRNFRKRRLEERLARGDFKKVPLSGAERNRLYRERKKLKGEATARPSTSADISDSDLPVDLNIHASSEELCKQCILFAKRDDLSSKEMYYSYMPCRKHFDRTQFHSFSGKTMLNCNAHQHIIGRKNSTSVEKGNQGKEFTHVKTHCFLSNNHQKKKTPNLMHGRYTYGRTQVEKLYKKPGEIVEGDPTVCSELSEIQNVNIYNMPISSVQNTQVNVKVDSNEDVNMPFHNTSSASVSYLSAETTKASNLPEKKRPLKIRLPQYIKNALCGLTNSKCIALSSRVAQSLKLVPNIKQTEMFASNLTKSKKTCSIVHHTGVANLSQNNEVTQSDSASCEQSSMESEVKPLGQFLYTDLLVSNESAVLTTSSSNVSQSDYSTLISEEMDEKPYPQLTVAINPTDIYPEEVDRDSDVEYEEIFGI